MGRCWKAFCGPIVAKSFRDKDTPSERALKKSIVQPFLILLILSACIMVSRTKDVKFWKISTIGVMIMLAGIAVGTLLTLFSNKSPVLVIELMMAIIPLSIVALDWGAAATLRPRVWSFIVIVLDCALVAGARTEIQYACIGGVLVWLAVERFEASRRFGMYEFLGEPFSPVVCDCVLPPCPAIPMKAITEMFGFSGVYLLDYWFTRGFATEMRRQKAVVQTAVDLAGDIAVSLSRYETDEALDLIDDTEADVLPDQLRDALGLLVQNLKTYKPYLPQSCLPGACLPDDDEAAFDEAALQLKQEQEAADAAADDTSPNSGSVAVTPLPSSMTPTETVTPTIQIAAPASPGERLDGQKLESVNWTAGRRLPPRVSAHALSDIRTPASPGRTNRSSRHGGDITSRHEGQYTNRSSMQSSVFSGASPKRTRARSRAAKSSIFSEAVSAAAPRQGRQAPPILGGPPKLLKKQATLLAANIRGYLDVARTAAASKLRDFHHRLLADLMACAAAHKALTDGIAGDRYYASVNGAKQALGHRVAAVRLACGVTEKAGPAAKQSGVCASGEPAPSLALSAGVCAGELLCGDLGCEGLLRYSFIGDAAAWVHAVERLATGWRRAVAANGVAARDAETAFAVRLRAAAVLQKPSHAQRPPQLVWEVVGAHAEQETDEWMYQLDAQEGKDAWRFVTKARKALYAGEFDAALSHVAAGRAAAAEGEAAAELRAAYDDVDAAAAARPAPPHLELHDSYLTHPDCAALLRVCGGGGGAAPAPPPASPAAGRIAAAASVVHQSRKDHEELAKAREADLEQQRELLKQRVDSRRDMKAMRGKKPQK